MLDDYSEDFGEAPGAGGEKETTVSTKLALKEKRKSGIGKLVRVAQSSPNRNAQHKASKSVGRGVNPANYGSLAFKDSYNSPKALFPATTAETRHSSMKRSSFLQQPRLQTLLPGIQKGGGGALKYHQSAPANTASGDVLQIIEHQIVNVKSQIKDIQDQASKMASNTDEAEANERLETLTDNNQYLNKELKNVNHLLSMFIEHVSAYNMKKKTIAQFDPNSAKERSPETVSKHKLSPITPSTRGGTSMNIEDQIQINVNKTTKNLQHEYDKLQERIQVVADPAFPLQLKRKLNDLNDQIRLLKQEQRHLQADKAKQGKRLNTIIKQGEPEGMKKVAIAEKQYDNLTARLAQMKIQEQRVKDLQENQSSKINEWKQKILQMDFKALKLGLDLGTDADREEADENFKSRPVGKRDTSSVLANTPQPINPTMYTSEMLAQREQFLKSDVMQNVLLTTKEDILNHETLQEQIQQMKKHVKSQETVWSTNKKLAFKQIKKKKAELERTRLEQIALSDQLEEVQEKLEAMQQQEGSAVKRPRPANTAIIRQISPMKPHELQSQTVDGDENQRLMDPDAYRSDGDNNMPDPDAYRSDGDMPDPNNYVSDSEQQNPKIINEEEDQHPINSKEIVVIETPTPDNLEQLDKEDNPELLDDSPVHTQVRRQATQQTVISQPDVSQYFIKTTAKPDIIVQQEKKRKQIERKHRESTLEQKVSQLVKGVHYKEQIKGVEQRRLAERERFHNKLIKMNEHERKKKQIGGAMTESHASSFFESQKMDESEQVLNYDKELSRINETINEQVELDNKTGMVTGPPKLTGSLKSAK